MMNIEHYPGRYYKSHSSLDNIAMDNNNNNNNTIHINDLIETKYHYENDFTGPRISKITIISLMIFLILRDLNSNPKNFVFLGLLLKNKKEE